MKSLQRIWFGFWISLPIIFIYFVVNYLTDFKFQPWLGLISGFFAYQAYKVGVSYYDRLKK